MPVVLIALGWFLLRTDAGVAVRSVADNSDRARLLGIPVRRLSTLVWVIAGVIAALTTVLSAPSNGLTISAGAGPTLILPALAAAIIAGMENLPLAFGAGVALGITSGLFQFNLPRYGSATGDVVNLVAILLGLLLLQKKRSRADDAEETFSATGILKPIPDVLRRLPEVVAGRLRCVRDRHRRRRHGPVHVRARAPPWSTRARWCTGSSPSPWSCSPGGRATSAWASSPSPASAASWPAT